MYVKRLQEPKTINTAAKEDDQPRGYRAQKSYKSAQLFLPGDANFYKKKRIGQKYAKSDANSASIAKTNGLFFFPRSRLEARQLFFYPPSSFSLGKTECSREVVESGTQ